MRVPVCAQAFADTGDFGIADRVRVVPAAANGQNGSNAKLTVAALAALRGITP